MTFNNGDLVRGKLYDVSIKGYVIGSYDRDLTQVLQVADSETSSNTWGYQYDVPDVYLELIRSAKEDEVRTAKIQIGNRVRVNDNFEDGNADVRGATGEVIEEDTENGFWRVKFDEYNKVVGSNALFYAKELDVLTSEISAPQKSVKPSEEIGSLTRRAARIAERFANQYAGVKFTDGDWLDLLQLVTELAKRVDAEPR